MKTGHSRLVPVHPTLAAILAEWKLKAWVEMTGRAPTPDDLVIPSREGVMRSRHHSRNKLLDDLKRLGLRHRRGDELRRTFITLARADGARADLLQMVSHHHKKDIINIYTSMPWAPLCEEVAKLKVERRKGQLFVLPKAANAEEEPQLAMFDGSDQPVEATTHTSVGTSVRNATKPDPKKLWDVRPLLKKVFVEAPGIELSVRRRQSSRRMTDCPRKQRRPQSVTRRASQPFRSRANLQYRNRSAPIWPSRRLSRWPWTQVTTTLLRSCSRYARLDERGWRHPACDTLSERRLSTSPREGGR